jgi:hypothetical protein
MKSADPESIVQAREENDSEMQLLDSQNIEESVSAVIVRNADLKIEDKK